MEQPETIHIIGQGILKKTPCLDVRDRVATNGPERWLLGLAFHPDYRRNGRSFVNDTRKSDGATVVGEIDVVVRRMKPLGMNEYAWL